MRQGGTGVSARSAERSWCVVVPHHASGARLARHRLAAVLADEVPPALLADLVAVLAELVGNAVRHADPLPGGVVRVAWRLRPEGDGQHVRVRVTDGGAASAPRMRAAGLDAADGRGLHIVAGLASRWGVDRDGLGQSVWADFDPAEVGRADLVAAG
ncbi:ATP-binding protein [Micromonospora echinospora]|uniref:ATP-binding protein n=1 Tax=Micromonospora echinospora TaxID=1877 RepID=UPI001472FC09|nr:ATP-binding protein [Micromonospora echinospora]